MRQIPLTADLPKNGALRVELPPGFQVERLAKRGVGQGAAMPPEEERVVTASNYPQEFPASNPSDQSPVVQPLPGPVLNQLRPDVVLPGEPGQR